MSLLLCVRKLEAQLEIAKRALWHYSKYLSWSRHSSESEARNLFNIYENQHYGNITSADQIARSAIEQIHAIDQINGTPFTKFKIKDWVESSSDEAEC